MLGAPTRGRSTSRSPQAPGRAAAATTSRSPQSRRVASRSPQARPSLPKPPPAAAHKVLFVELVEQITTYLDYATATRCRRVNKAWATLCRTPGTVVINRVEDLVPVSSERRCDIALHGYCVQLPYPRKSCMRSDDYAEMLQDRARQGVITAAVLEAASRLPIVKLYMAQSVMAENDPGESWAQMIKEEGLRFRREGSEDPTPHDAPASVDDWARFLATPLPGLQVLTIDNDDLIGQRPSALSGVNGAGIQVLEIGSAMTSISALNVIRSCPNLRSLDVGGFWSESFSGYLPSDQLPAVGSPVPVLSNLRRLRCLRSVLAGALIAAAPNLEVLDGGTRWFDKIATPLPRLRIFRCGQRGGDAEVNALLLAAPNLEELHIESHNNTDVTLAGLDAAAIGTATRLRVVRLGANHRVTLGGLQRLRAIAPNLASLELEYFKGDAKAAMKLFPEGVAKIRAST